MTAVRRTDVASSPPALVAARRNCKPMMSTLAFAAGFAAGWLSRSAIGSKSALVQIVALGLDGVARVKRAAAIEREHLEDLMAEARDVVARRRAERARNRVAEAAPVEHAA
jgi:hypothetical protein